MSERVLAAGLGDSRPPQLVGEKQQNQCPEGKESPSGRGHDSSLSHVILPMAASSRPVLQAPGSSIQVIIRRCASTFLPGAPQSRGASFRSVRPAAGYGGGARGGA